MPVSGSKISSPHWDFVLELEYHGFVKLSIHQGNPTAISSALWTLCRHMHIIVVICSTVQHRSQTYTYRIEYTCTIHWYNFQCNFRRVLPISTYIYMVRSIDKSQLCEICIHWIYSVFLNISGSIWIFFSIISWSYFPLA